MKTTFNEKGQMVLVINDTLSITLEEADFEYRSHINGMQALSPNNWVACEATGSDGNHYTAWYFVSDTTDISLEDIYDFIKEPEYKDWDDALKEMSFTERMFFLTSILTNDGDIAEVIKASIVVIFLNADLLYIDLLWHIEQKMKYNELRENKHGKKY